MNPDDRNHPMVTSRLAPSLAGAVVVLAGGIILTGWIAGLPTLRSLLPQQVEAKANTAFCFILTGLALLLKSGRDQPSNRPRVMVANFCAGLASLIGLATLGQYYFGWNLGIDELLFRDSPTAAFTVHPGRMALPTAFSFFLLGAAELLLETARERIAVAWLVAPAVLFAGLAFVGHLYDLPFLASWGPFTPIAALTGATFLLLSAGVLLAGCDRLVARLHRSGRTIGFVFALLLLVLMVGAVLRNTQALIRNTREVTHTHEVLGQLTETLSAMQDVETGARGYLLTGDPGFLEPNEHATVSLDQLKLELRSLVADNPAQLRRLGRLEQLIDGKVTSARRQIALRQEGDTAGAQSSVTAGEGKRLMDDIRQVVTEMETEENRLLREGQTRTEASTLRTLLALGTGMVLSVALLLTIFTLLRREIARRAQTEAALSRSEKNLAVTLHSIGDAVLATDTEGRITLMNHLAEQLTGWTLAGARGRPIAEIFHIINEETRQPAVIPVGDVLATGKIQGLANHTVLLARDGTERAIADSAAPIHDDEGRILGVVLVFRDVTAEQAARKALRESEARYRTLFESIDQGFCIIEMIFDDQGQPVDFRFLEINPSFAKQTGLVDALGRRMRELAPLLEAHWFDIYGRIALTGEAVRFQNRAEQLHRTFDVYAFRFGEPKNRQVAILFSDITERQRVQAELDRFFSLSVDFLCIASSDGYFKRVSPAVTDMLGWSTEEFLARPFIEFVHPEDHAATLHEVERQVVAGEKVLHFENRYRHKDGSWRVLSWRSVPLPGGLMYATARDVTELKHSEEQIRQLNLNLQQHAAQLEATNHELEAFSYSVSHDLRAPLRSIEGFSRILLEDYSAKLDADGRDSLNRIGAAAQRMAQLIDDLLNLSRVTRAELHREPVDLSAVARTVAAELRQREPGRPAELTVADGVVADGDPHLLRVVLENLLGNAWKFTAKRDHALIEFGTSQQNGQTSYFVRDNGAGFDAKYAGKLFGAFQRLHSSTDFPGTGVGLATVQRIVRRHGGRTWAEGVINHGATFFFNLGTQTNSTSPFTRLSIP